MLFARQGQGVRMDQEKIDPDVDALVKRIFALKPESKARVLPELKMVAKGPKRAKKKATSTRPPN